MSASLMTMNENAVEPFLVFRIQARTEKFARNHLYVKLFENSHFRARFSLSPYRLLEGRSRHFAPQPSDCSTPSPAPPCVPLFSNPSPNIARRIPYFEAACAAALRRVIAISRPLMIAISRYRQIATSRCSVIAITRFCIDALPLSCFSIEDVKRLAASLTQTYCKPSD